MKRAITSFLLLIVVVCISTAKTYNIFKSPVEKELISCYDGKKVKGLYYEAKKEIDWIKVNYKSDYIIVCDKQQYYYIVNKHTFEVVSKLSKEPYPIADGYLIGKLKPFSIKKPIATLFYNFKNEEIWRDNGSCQFLSDSLGIAVLYEFNSKDNLHGVDIKTGNVLWSQSMKCKNHFPWYETRTAKDSVNLYLIGDSLYMVNIQTGKMKSHEFTASEREPLKSVLSVSGFNYYDIKYNWRADAYASVDEFMLVGTHSNWVESGDSLFIADASNVYCFNSKLDELWRTPIPDNMGSKSELRLYGNTLYMLNYGVAFQKARAGRYGRPFYATYNRHNGEQKSLIALDLKKKLYDGIYVPGKVYLRDIAGERYIEEGSDVVNKLKWEPDTKVESERDHVDRIIYDTVYVKNNGMLEPVTTNAEHLVLEVNEYDVNVVNCNGEVKKYPGSEVFFHDYRNVYSTNTRRNICHIAVVDSKTKHIQLEFKFNGNCKITKDGDIWLLDDKGIGIIHPSKK